jgi:hypothetical protein
MDSFPMVTARRGGIRYLCHGDDGYEEMVERIHWRRILETALGRVCTCTHHVCGHCEGHWNENCPVHGDED